MRKTKRTTSSAPTSTISIDAWCASRGRRSRGILGGARGARLRFERGDHQKSRLPRHKVCGEFLSPEAVTLLDRLGVSGAFFDAHPARIRRMAFFAGQRSQSAVLLKLPTGRE